MLVLLRATAPVVIELCSPAASDQRHVGVMIPIMTAIVFINTFFPFPSF